MAEIEHFLDPNLKYKPYDMFKLVEHLEVYIWSEQDQLASKSHAKIKLRDAVTQVNSILSRFVRTFFKLAKCLFNLLNQKECS